MLSTRKNITRVFKSDKLQLAFCSCLTYFSQLQLAAYGGVIAHS
jgi:hypothetical protein